MKVGKHPVSNLYRHLAKTLNKTQIQSNATLRVCWYRVPLINVRVLSSWKMTITIRYSVGSSTDRLIQVRKRSLSAIWTPIWLNLHLSKLQLWTSINKVWLRFKTGLIKVLAILKQNGRVISLWRKIRYRVSRICKELAACKTKDRLFWMLRVSRLAT